MTSFVIVKNHSVGSSLLVTLEKLQGKCRLVSVLELQLVNGDTVKESHLSEKRCSRTTFSIMSVLPCG